MKSLRFRIIITFILSTIVILILMRLYHSHYLLYRPEYFVEGLGTFLPSVAIIMGICAVTVSIMCAPLDKLWSKVKERGDSLTQDEKKTARRIIAKIPGIISIVNLLGYIIGPVMTISLRLNGESFFQITNIVTVLYNVGLGLLAALFQIKAADIHLRGVKEGLNIYYIEDSKKRASSSNKLMLAVIVAIYVSMITFFTATIGYLLNGRDIITLTGLIIRFSILGIILLTLVGAIIYTFVSDIPRQLTTISSKLKELSDGSGDLSQRMSIIDFDEFGILTDRINRYIDSLKEILSKVKETCSSVSTISNDMFQISGKIDNSLKVIDDKNNRVATATLSQTSLVNSADDKIHNVLLSISGVSDKVNSQSGYVSNSSAAIAQMVSNIGSVSTIASKANNHAKGLKTVSDKGQKAIIDTAKAFEDVDGASKEMKVIVSMISKVAAQTNLLAMNAAIEAAHAGESGKGFAVVADEVRKLAEDSSKSITKIVDLIKDMTIKIERGVTLSRDAQNAFGKISEDIIETTNLIGTISSAMEEQQHGAEEILSSIESLVDATDTILEYSNKQKSESSDIEVSISELKNHSIKISEDVDDQRDSFIEIEELSRNILSMTKDNNQAVEELEQTISKFNF